MVDGNTSLLSGETVRKWLLMYRTISCMIESEADGAGDHIGDTDL